MNNFTETSKYLQTFSTNVEGKFIYLNLVYFKTSSLISIHNKMQNWEKTCGNSFSFVMKLFPVKSLLLTKYKTSRKVFEYQLNLSATNFFFPK